MLQQTLFPPPSLTVSEITRYLRELFESDEILREVWVQGEISNLSLANNWGYVILWTNRNSLMA